MAKRLMILLCTQCIHNCLCVYRSVFGDEMDQPMSLPSSIRTSHDVKRMGSDTDILGVHEALNYADQ